MLALRVKTIALLNTTVIGSIKVVMVVNTLLGLIIVKMTTKAFRTL